MRKVRGFIFRDRSGQDVEHLPKFTGRNNHDGTFDHKPVSKKSLRKNTKRARRLRMEQPNVSN